MVARSTLASIAAGSVESQLYFPEKIHFLNVKSFVFNFFTISQNLFMAEVTGEVLELAVEERIQPDGRHALVSPEKKNRLLLKKTPSNLTL